MKLRADEQDRRTQLKQQHERDRIDEAVEDVLDGALSEYIGAMDEGEIILQCEMEGLRAALRYAFTAWEKGNG